MLDLKEALESIDGYKIRVDVSTNKADVYDVSGKYGAPLESPVPPNFVFFIRPDSTDPEDKDTLFMCTDIMLTNPWLASAVAIYALNVAKVALLPPIVQDTSTGEVYSDNDAYSRLGAIGDGLAKELYGHLEEHGINLEQFDSSDVEDEFSGLEMPAQKKTGKILH